MNEINLLPNRKKNRLENDTTQGTLRVVSSVALALVILISISLFLLVRFNGLDTIQQSQNNTLTSLTLLHNKTAKILLIHDRLTAIQSILNSRSSLEASIDEIIQGAPSDISFDEFSIAQGQLTMTASSQSLSSLDTLNTTLTNMVLQKRGIKNYIVNAFGLDQITGKFALQITAQL